jgi:hypothetical protein
MFYYIYHNSDDSKDLKVSQHRFFSKTLIQKDYFFKNVLIKKLKYSE